MAPGTPFELNDFAHDRASFRLSGTDMHGDDKIRPASDRSLSEPDINYIHGARFWIISVAIAIIMFLVNFEVPVIITALVSITNDLQGFENVAWVIASYLLGYVGIIVIVAKFSDIFGRKIVFMLSLGVFIIFSAACSAAQTMNQLIVFRAFQGVGGGGSWSLATIFVTELVPPENYPKFVANISITNALALLLGPIIGGAIASGTTWRWIFIINIPIALPALLILLYAVPNGFPHHNQPNYKRKTFRDLISKPTLDRIDTPGTVLILLATLSLTAAFEEADKRFPWRSAYVITLLTVSGLLWIMLIAWERHVTLSRTIREPVLPWGFVVNREMMGILLNFVLLGGPTVICMFILPQRFQLVYGTSGLEAGVRLIPFSAVIPVGSIFASVLGGKHKVPPLYLLDILNHKIFGSVLQVLGFALIGTLPSTLEIPSRIYGYQILAGWGCGINFSLLFILIPLVNNKKDGAVALGAGSQFRFIGGSIVLSISTSIFNSYVRPRLQTELGIADPDVLLQVLPTLAPSVQDAVRHVLATGYSHQILVLAVSAGLQIPATLLMWKRPQLKLP
ncbi:putative multidrug resistance protein fnx1 [Xylariaceae sp. FL1019]|nr:putative multidrug resistance protein fnx1 [Xylariaceae sp. FL1019]